MKGAERIVAVATSAVREASNGDEFLARVKARTGLELRILSGEEEGRLILRAVREGVDLGNGFSVVVDVGGGSHRVDRGSRRRGRQVVSLELGSLRCAQRRLPLREGGRAAVAAPPSLRLRSEVRESIAKLRVPARLERFVATSGTARWPAPISSTFLAGRDWKAASGVLARGARTRPLRIWSITCAGSPAASSPRSRRWARRAPNRSSPAPS